jgi:hypothetical protein
MTLDLTDDETAAPAPYLREKLDDERLPASLGAEPWSAMRQTMNAYNGPPMTRGNVAAAKVRFIV